MTKNFDPNVSLECFLKINFLFISLFIAKELNGQIAETKKTHLSYLGSMKKNNMVSTPPTPDGVEVLIGNMKVNKVDPNSISTKI